MSLSGYRTIAPHPKKCYSACMNGWKSTEDLVRRLSARVNKSTLKAVAADLSISPQYLSDIIHERRALSERVAERLGYRPVLHWAPVSGR